MRSALNLLPLLALLFAPAPLAGAAFERPSWADVDHDCQDTRAEVLISRCALAKLDRRGCRVVQATCQDPYSGAEVATDSPGQAIAIDHVLPAAEGWKRRAWRQKDGRLCDRPTGCASFRAFYNDTRNLLPIRSRTNSRKGDLMPQEWCPREVAARPILARGFRATARRYSIPIKPKEEAGLRAWAAGRCAGGAKILG